MYLKFWSLVIYLMTTVAVSTVQARCSFIPDCKACYVSTYGETREQDLWTVVCKHFNCFTLYPGLRSLNSSVELLDLSYSHSLTYNCSNQCTFSDSNPPSVYGIDMSNVNWFFPCTPDAGLVNFLNSLKIKLGTLKLNYATLRRYLDTLNFSSYPMLRSLDLSGTFHVLRYGYISLDGATSLETLFLDNNRLSEVPSAIRNMTSLKHLSLKQNFLDRTSLNKPDIFPITLESLDLSHNEFRGIADFSWLNSVNLRTLKMQNTSIGGNHLPRRLGNMSNLEILDISASVLNMHPFYHIEVFSRLMIFNFSFNRLQDVPTAIQKSLLLHQLYLRSNDITYVAPKTFVNISNMSVLDLGGNKISSLPTFAFSGVEKSLKLLYLDGNQLETLDKCTISRLTRLRKLRIGGNPFHCDCKIAWLRSYRDNKGVDIDLDRAFCNSPIVFKEMDVSGFSTEGCAPSQLTLDVKDCFKFISPTSNAVTETSPKHTDSITAVDELQQMTLSHDVTHVNEFQPLTSLHFSRQALASSYLAIGFSATCLAIIFVYITVTGCRFYRRCRGKQSKATTKSERTMSGIQDTNFTEAGETGPYQELESVSPYQNVADGNRQAENSYEALNPHTAI